MVTVIDASIAVKWFVKESDSESAIAILDAVFRAPGDFLVPELFFFELWSVLSRIVPRPQLADLASRVVEIAGCGLLRHPYSDDVARASIVFIQRGLSGYDACYAGLAKLVHGRWLTADRKAHEKILDLGVSELWTGES